MGKCASKQHQQQLRAHTSGFHQRNCHQELFQQQIFNAYKKNNGQAVDFDATRSSISEQNIFLLIENEVILFYRVVEYSPFTFGVFDPVLHLSHSLFPLFLWKFLVRCH